MMQAARTLVRLGIDTSQPIDIFGVIQEESIWLMFQPLKNLYGFYMKQKGTPGIGIHSKHPLKLQRYTAAHEYGHHILGHAESFDGDAYIERGYSSADLKELAADTFAAYFLMPEQLVNTLLNRMGLLRVGRPLTDIEIYQLSLNLGTSYKATVNHLMALKILTPEDAEILRPIKPQQIKAQLQTQPLENSWAESWALVKADNGKKLSLRVYDDLRIDLPENPTTGYVWTFDEAVVDGADSFKSAETKLLGQESDMQPSLFGVSELQDKPFPLMLIDSSFGVSENQETYGGGGNRYFTVRTLIPGLYTLRLLERRPWEDEAEAVDEWRISLDVNPKPTGESSQGFVASQQKAVASTMLQGSEPA